MATRRPSWSRIAMAALLVLVAVGAYTVGRVSDDSESQAVAATGYDIGVAGKPKSNGQLREFQLTAQPATCEIAPGVIVPVISYDRQVPGPTIRVTEGDIVRVRIINISNFAHPMHLHGQDFTVIAKDGEPIRPVLQQTMNTISVDAGETSDIVFWADNPGTWVFHCHELHHTENDGVEPGGLIQVVQYEGETTVPGTGAPAQPTTTPNEMDDTPGM